MKKKKNRKIILVLIIVLVIIITVISVIVFTKDNEKIIEENKGNQTEVKVTGMLLEYINSLEDNYYLKYYGKFKDESGNLTNAIVEYTRAGKDFAIKSSELNMHLIYTKNKLYSISHRYNIIVKIPNNSYVVAEYNLASDIAQEYIKSYKEMYNGEEYDIEEYKLNQDTLKYYFLDKDLKLIKYNDNEIKIIRKELSKNEKLFEKTNNYIEIIN